jgi:DNA-directed RNA polymerase specialized sigma24 family protein
MTMTDTSARARFAAFVAEVEPRLRRALVAAYGGERGREAVAEALAWGWEHWADLEAMDNPAGYLYRVGQSRTRPRKQAPTFEAPPGTEPWVEPQLLPALAALTERQRVAVVLVHGFGWTHREVAELTGLAVTSVQNHVERGLEKLRAALEVRDA